MVVRTPNPPSAARRGELLDPADELAEAKGLIARGEAEEGLDRLRRVRQSVLLSGPQQGDAGTLVQVLTLARAAQARAKTRLVRRQADDLVAVLQSDLRHLPPQAATSRWQRFRAARGGLGVLGIWLMLIGAGLVVLGMFLPLRDTPDWHGYFCPDRAHCFAPSVGEAGYAVPFFVLAAVAVAETVRLVIWPAPRDWFGIVIGAVASLGALVLGTDTTVQWVENPEPFLGGYATHAGAGLWVAGIGGLVTACGALFVSRATFWHPPPEPQ